jgi:hypothetical protein
VQGKSPPLDFDLKILLQFFNTPGNEIAPGSYVIRKNLQLFWLLHIVSSPSSDLASPWFNYMRILRDSPEVVQVQLSRGPVWDFIHIASNQFLFPFPLFFSGKGKIPVPVEFILSRETQFYSDPFPSSSLFLKRPSLYLFYYILLFLAAFSNPQKYSRGTRSGEAHVWSRFGANGLMLFRIEFDQGFLLGIV